jgi:hypothetical protein
MLLILFTFAKVSIQFDKSKRYAKKQYSVCLEHH